MKIVTGKKLILPKPKKMSSLLFSLKRLTININLACHKNRQMLSKVL